MFIYIKTSIGLDLIYSEYKNVEDTNRIIYSFEARIVEIAEVAELYMAYYIVVFD